jgi:K+/H+ antiporter YhaU regulatory subunit KhtT
MKTINEAPLPGIGRKLWLQTEQDERVSIIAYNGGDYEIYLIPKGEEFPTAAVHLSDEEASALGTAFPHEHKEQTSPRLEVESVVIASASSHIGGMADSLHIGSAFIAAVEPVAGASALQANGHSIEAGDTLYIAGGCADRRKLMEMLQADA